MNYLNRNKVNEYICNTYYKDKWSNGVAECSCTVRFKLDYYVLELRTKYKEIKIKLVAKET